MIIAKLKIADKFVIAFKGGEEYVKVHAYATPAPGSIELDIKDKYVADQLVVGKEYYLDFIPVEEAQVYGVDYSNTPGSIMHHPV